MAFAASIVALGWFVAPCHARAQERVDAPAASPSTPSNGTLPEAWWTGSMLSNSAATLPKGHALIEPYAYDRLAGDTATYGSFTYMLYGLTDYLTVGAVPSFGYATESGRRISSGVGVGDLSLRAQLRLRASGPSSWKPALAVSLAHSLPIGRFDRLGALPGNGEGTGLAATTVSLYAQSLFRTRSGRPIRVRLNASATLPASTSVSGVSVYGTPEGSSTRVRQATTISLGTSVEYSLSRGWALAFDAFSLREGGLALTSKDPALPPSRRNEPGSAVVALAPGVEYSWTANLGVLLAARYVPGSASRPASWTPALALNVYL
ncbi:transporter [Sphingomonas sp. CROZ-RG-20F-R02-07]|uniref:transporter n=1 Tax=Sphingomonas sp. CROZ-RG-20F-R02-07 TaxID=2914832 RepID=UPI001F598E5D|nr:transporter [Sphingomonas sp. CROZ-RG-20F-R02-07]